MKTKSEILTLAHKVAKFSYKNDTGKEAMDIYNNIFRFNKPATYLGRLAKALSYIYKAEKSDNSRGKTQQPISTKQATYKQFEYLNKLRFQFGADVKNFSDFQKKFTINEASQLINDAKEGFIYNK